MAVTTIANIPNVIIPASRMIAHYLYFLAAHTLSFIYVDHPEHSDTRGCVFDDMGNKTDILKSMKGRALCDECRSALANQRAISPDHLQALDRILAESGALVKVRRNRSDAEKLPKGFIGSSTEGLRIAHLVAKLIKADADVDVWDQGTVFGLGTATLEALELAVLRYQFGIFIFTPDDELNTRGESKPVARDNVIFELGLFIGKLTRRRAFIVRPAEKAIELPSDLSGIKTAVYDPKVSDLDAALRPTCEEIRNAIRRANSFLTT